MITAILALDSTGQVLLAIMVVVFLAGVIGYVLAAKLGPRWLVGVIGMVCLGAGAMLGSTQDRITLGLGGTLSILGLFGLLYGLALFLRKPKSDQHEEPRRKKKW